MKEGVASSDRKIAKNLAAELRKDDSSSIGFAPAAGSKQQAAAQTNRAGCRGKLSVESCCKIGLPLQGVVLPELARRRNERAAGTAPHLQAKGEAVVSRVTQGDIGGLPAARVPLDRAPSEGGAYCKCKVDLQSVEWRQPQCQRRFQSIPRIERIHAPSMRH